jgi:hypothetical protein
MKVKEAIEILKEMDKNKEITIFAEGKIYPCINLKELKESIYIYCGWSCTRDDTIM